MRADEYFECYSDGSSYNNGKKYPHLPSFVSCGVVITYDHKILKKGRKLYMDQTISYAELKGVILVLDLLQKRILDVYTEYITPPYNIRLYTDSQFVANSINLWMPKWLANLRAQHKDWRTDPWYNASGGIVGQYTLFREIKLRYLDHPAYHITVQHIKGHTGKTDFHSQMNALCDKLATDLTQAHKRALGLS